MADAEQSPLLVMEYSGTARSGKGTIVADLCERYMGVASEETGADYRAITRALLMTGYLEADMPPEQVTQLIEGMEGASLADLAAQRNTIVAELGRDSLYEADVEGLVKSVSPVPAVRTAVKTGFASRVAAVRDEGQHRVLVVDGRNLADVVKTIPGTELVLRTFVSCFDIEAATREAQRRGVALGSPEFQEIHRNIRTRNQTDASRPVDAVKPEADALDYWEAPEVTRLTLQRKADLLYGGNLTESTRHEAGRHPNGAYGVIRNGAGRIAVERGVQIHFDTTNFRNISKMPVAAMVEAAHTMFVEALETRNVLAASRSNSFGEIGDRAHNAGSD